MNLMPFICQGFSQFCCQYTTSAKSRIANNSNIHVSSLIVMYEGKHIIYLKFGKKLQK